MIKIYAIYKMENAVFEFPVGKSSFRCEFTGGNLKTKVKIPSTYSTSNPIRQHVIEQSERFKNGMITLLSKYEVVESEKGEAPILKDVTNELKEIAEVTTKGEAIEYLKGLGVKAGQMRTDSRIREQATLNGVSFPNWKEEA